MEEEVKGRKPRALSLGHEQQQAKWKREGGRGTCIGLPVHVQGYNVAIVPPLSLVVVAVVVVVAKVGEQKVRREVGRQGGKVRERGDRGDRGGSRVGA